MRQIQQLIGIVSLLGTASTVLGGDLELPPEDVYSNFQPNAHVAGSGLQLLQNADGPQALFAQVAPNADGYTLELEKSSTTGATEHSYYQIFAANLPVWGAYFSIHKNMGRVVMLRVHAPAASAPTVVPEFALAAEQTDAAQQGAILRATQILFEDQGVLAPGYILQVQDRFTREPREMIADATTGRVLRDKSAQFDVSAEVFNRNSAETLAEQTLDNLTSPSRLDGKNFSIYAPDEDSPRVNVSDGKFNFDPSSQSDDFNQVQAYFGAGRILKFYHDRFGYDMGDTKLVVRVNITDQHNNAWYTPALSSTSGHPEISIADGDDRVMRRDLAQDNDVIAHEFGHHIVYRAITSTDGESGIIHEGTADYFAYALSGDPHLAKTIMVGAPYLRTADLGDGRFDDPRVPQKKHILGQYWSAVLWDVRTKVGPDWDSVTYHALDYLGKRSGFKDYFTALLQADRDSFPLNDTSSHKCDLLEAAVSRGFAQYLADFDGSDCGLDLAQAAESSRQFNKSLAPPTDGNHGASSTLRFCGVIGENSQTPCSWLVLLLPMILALGRFLIPFARHRRD